MKLTPLGKTTLKVLGAVALLSFGGAVAYHLGLGEMLNSSETANSTPAVEITQPTVKTETKTKSWSLFSGEKANTKGSERLGSRSNPLKVSIVSFHGYAPALLANGGSLVTKPGSLFEKNGVHVEFIIQDDIPPLATIFISETAHCSWRTSDFWAQEQPNLRNAGYDGKAIMVVDNTQGADAIISNDSSIQSIEDLAGKKIGLLQYTPSDGMVIDALNNSSLSNRKKQTVQFIYINVDAGLAGVGAALKEGHVDAVAMWDPDLSLVQKETNSHVVYSTATATNLIYDVIVCDQRVLDNPENDLALEGFVAGWMEGVEYAEVNPSRAADALIQTEEFFALLAKDQGKPFIESLFSNLDWTGLADNARILGIVGDPNHYERVYRQFDKIYRNAGALANPKSPVIAPSQSFEYKYIQRLVNEDLPAVQEEAHKPTFTFSKKEAKRVSKRKATLTKPVYVTFATGKSTLSHEGKELIRDEMIPIIDANGSAYFLLSGNTDSTGSKSINDKLSRLRAKAVYNYLVNEWDINPDRLLIKGNGSSDPLCDESYPEGEGLTLGECREVNRTTRLAILSR